MEIKLGEVTLYYEVVGTGTPLVMIHGNGEDHTIFEEAAARLSDRFTCYLIDSRGHGKSSPVQSYDYEAMAEDVLAFIDALALKDVTYYGFSDGGIIGLLAASYAWSKEHGRTAAKANNGAANISCEANESSAADALAAASSEIKTLIVSGANTQPKAVVKKLYYRLKIENFFKQNPLVTLLLTQPDISAEQLRTIRAKTLILAGAGDLIVESDTRKIADNIPGAEMRILPGEDHGSYIVHSEKIAEILLDFCK